MEEILNEYGDIYKCKERTSEFFQDDIQSLNNNYSIDENERNFDSFPHLFEELNQRSFDLNFNYEENSSEISHFGNSKPQSSIPVDVHSTNQGCNS